jgi:hypothetical protein
VRDEVLLPSLAGFLRYDIAVPRRALLGGQRRALAGGVGSGDARKAETRRATKVARNTWPVSASMTATARPSLPAAVKSPYPSVVSVLKLKYWKVWVLAGCPLAKKCPPPRCSIAA